MILIVPNGVTSVLFHMMRVFEVGAKLQLPTTSFSKMFIDNPQSTCNLMGLSSISISGKISLGRRLLSDGSTEHVCTFDCYASFVVDVFIVVH